MNTLGAGFRIALFLLLPIVCGDLHGQAAGASPGPADPTPGEVVELLRADTTREEGRAALARLSATLPPEQATIWIRLLAASERMTPERLAGAAVATLSLHRGDEREARRQITTLVDGLTPDPDASDPTSRAAVLGFAAHLSDPLDPAQAALLRERLLEEDPDAVGAPEAALLLGRHLLGDPATASRGLTILEDLLVRSPAHPVAPEARRLRQGAIARGVSPASDPEGPSLR